MRVLYCHKTKEPKARDCVASVDFEIDADMRLYALRLIRQPDGAYTIYAPQMGGQRRTATFSREMSERLTAMAVAAYEAVDGR